VNGRGLRQRIAVTAVLFAMIYKFMPRAEVSWHDVLI
jgi:uncharacterized BrkB/YihY/UPF0761 family membrane protein